MQLPDFIDPTYHDPDIAEPTYDDLLLEGLFFYGLPEADRHRPPTDDPKPEHVQYRDEGCDVAPECLACPLPKCRHDDPGWLGRGAKNRRNREIVAARLEQGISPTVIAQRFGLTRRRVQSIIREGKADYAAYLGRAAEDEVESHTEATRGI